MTGWLNLIRSILWVGVVRIVGSEWLFVKEKKEKSEDCLTQSVLLLVG